MMVTYKEQASKWYHQQQSSPASCQHNFLIFWFSSSLLMGAAVNLLPCTDCSPGLIIPPVTALWLMDIGWSEIANWKIGVEHRDFYEFTLWVKLRDVFKHFIFDHEPFKFTTKNILCVCQHNARFTLSLCVRSEVILKKSSNLYCRLNLGRVLMVGTKVSKGFFV